MNKGDEISECNKEKKVRVWVFSK